MIWDALYIGKVIYSACGNIPGVALRVYPLRIPQEVSLQTTPALSYYIISATPEDTKDSRSLCDTVSFQVSIFGATYTLVSAIAQSVRDSLDGMTGEVAGVSIDYMRFENWADDYENDTKLFHKAMEFSCRINNPASTIGSLPTSELSNIISVMQISADYTWTGAVPAGCVIESIIFEESTGSSGQLSCGTTVGGSDVFKSEAITGGALTVINVDKALSTTANKTLYLNHASDGDEWNGMIVTVYGMLRKII